MISYFEWNKALAEYFFKEEYDDNNVFLCITHEDIDRIGSEIFDINDGHLDYLKALIDRTVFITDSNDLVTKANFLKELNLINDSSELKELHKYREKYPPYLSFLVFFCLAEMEVVKDASAHLYYPKIFKLLKRVKESNLNEYFPEFRGQSDKMSLLNPLWRDLESWSSFNNKGRFREYKNESYQKYVGKARINAILSYSDRINIYKILSINFSNNYLPSILDIAPIIQKFVKKHADVFSRNEIFNESVVNSNKQFIRDAIYNILISDLKNELVKEIESNSNQKTEKVIGTFRSREFPNFSKITFLTNDNIKFNNKDKEILSKWLNGGIIRYKDKNYEIKKGRLKIFTKNQKSLEILGNPFIQVNRIIEDTDKYIFGVYKHDERFDRFQKWVEKHVYEIKDITENIALDWKFYEVDRPNHNLKEYDIIIHRSRQQELHLHNPTIILKGGLKIHADTYLGGFEPKILIENFNFFKKNEQYELNISSKVSDGEETQVNEYTLNMYEGFCELEINYLSINTPCTINIKIDILDDTENQEIEMIYAYSEFIIEPPYFTQSLWENNFGFIVYNYPQVGKVIESESNQEIFLNIFNKPSLEINNQNFQQIEPLLIRKKILSAEYQSVTQKQLQDLLEKIDGQQRLFLEDEDNITILIKIIHLMQVFLFIFKKYIHDSEFKSEKLLIENIIEKTGSRYSGNKQEGYPTVEHLLFSKQPLFAPFILWIILKEKVLYDNNHSLIFGDVFMEFLYMSYDYKESSLSKIIPLWEYNEMITLIFFVFNEKNGFDIKKTRDQLKMSWPNRGMNLNLKNNRGLKIYYQTLSNKYSNNYNLYHNYYQEFKKFIKSNSGNGYGFEHIINAEFNTKDKTLFNSNYVQVNVHKRSDHLLQTLCNYINRKRNKKVDKKVFKDLFYLVYPDIPISNKIIFNYKKNLRALGHICERNNKIYILPPYLNLILHDPEEKIGKYLLSGARDKYTLTELKSIGKKYNIKINIDSQDNPIDPNRVLIDISDKFLEKYVDDINNHLGNKFISLNKNKNIFSSILQKYKLNDKFKSCNIFSPDADYLSKTFYDYKSYSYTKKPIESRFNFIKYIVEIYGKNFPKFFLKDNKNNVFYKMRNEHEGLLHYFSKINKSFIYYIEKNEMLLSPLHYSFPDEIEKALVVRSGLIPKSNPFEGSLNCNDLQSSNWKGYYNISKYDLILLEQTINQEAKTISIS